MEYASKISGKATSLVFINHKYHKYTVLLLTQISVIIWLVSILQAKQNEIGDYGLFTALPWTYYLAFSLLLTSMYISLLRLNTNPSKWLYLLLILQCFLIMVFIFFTPALIEGTARAPHSWLKYGYTDYIVRNGHISQAATFYHNWPVPFIFSAQLVLITSISPISFPLIFPLILDIVLFSTIVLFFFRFFEDTKKRIIGISLFYLISWESQFHYAPQFFGFVIFILIIYLVLFYLKKENIKMLTIIGVMFVLLVLTHLLTAFVAGLFISLVILYQMFWPDDKSRPERHNKKKFKLKFLLRREFWKLFWRNSLDIKIKSITANKRKLGLIAGIGIAGVVIWVMFAGDWLDRVSWNFNLSIFPSLLSAYFDKAYTGSAAHGNLVIIRMIFSIIIALLALIGAKLAYDRGNVRTMFIIIISAIIPIFLFYYGVEIVQRAFLFSALPLALLISMGLEKKKFLALILIFSFIAVPIHILAHYGNEKLDYIPPSQISGAEFIFQNVPEGVLCSGNRVDYSQYIEQYTRISFSQIDTYSNPAYDLYIVYSSSNEHFILWYLGSKSHISNLKDKINSDDYMIIFNSPDCQIYKYVG